MTVEILAEKHGDEERPVPTAWRSTFHRIVKSFIDKDYGLRQPIADVAPVSVETAQQVQDYIEDYGETLVELPEHTWETSICIWMGIGWDVHVDLWTEGEGRSDMVLSIRVVESNASLIFHLEMVYVP